jgi:(2R)-3-sulfolactate dehydrogenase (NADP+)
MKFDPNAVRDALEELLVDRGVSRKQAAATAEVLVEAESEGLASHGLDRVPQYLAQIDKGGVNATANVRVEMTGPATAIVHGDNGLGAPAGFAAVEALCARVNEIGIGAVAVHRAAHAGPLSAYVGRVAERGHVALGFANAPPALAPAGGATPVLGTNPIAFAAPAEDGPLIVDLALGVGARGKVLAARSRGEAIPNDWAVDEQGEPTTDPDAALRGALLPVGGAKGYALAMMVETLAGFGGLLSFQLPMPWNEPDRASTPGLFLVGLAPERFGVREDYDQRMGALVQGVRDAGGRLPGDRRRAARTVAADAGLDIDEPLLSQLIDIGLRLRRDP